MTDKLKLVVVVDGNEVSLDLGDASDFPLAITYQTAEIKTNLANDKRLEDRKGTFSKTFDVPATKKNCTALNHIWNVNILNSEVEQIKDKLPARLEDSTGTLLEGFIQVESVINLRGEVNKFNLIFFGDNFSWIEELGKLDISGIGLDEIPFDETSIEDSWDANADTQDYVFPLVNFGSWLHNYVSASEMYPAIYIRNIFTKAFATFNYQIVSNFINGSFFKKLILLANKTRTDVPDVSFRADRNSASSFVFTNHPDDSYVITNVAWVFAATPYLEITLADNSDSNGHGFVVGEAITLAGITASGYNGTVVIFEVVEDSPGGYVSHVIKVSGLSTIVNHGTSSGGTATRIATAIRTSSKVIEFPVETSDPQNAYVNPYYTANIAHREGIEAQLSATGSRGNADANVVIAVQKNSADVDTAILDSGDIGTGATPGNWQLTNHDDYLLRIVSGSNYSQIGDVYNAIIKDASSGGTPLYSALINNGFSLIGDTQHLMNFSISEVLVASSLQALNVLDLFKDTVVMFNLFVRTDVENKKVYIEPRDDFYKSISDAVDWREFLPDGTKNPNAAPIDQTKDQKLEFLRDMAIEQLFKYKEDSKDGYVKEIEKPLPLPILSHLETLSARFKKGREEITTKKLAPSWYIYDEDISPTSGGILIPRLWKDYADDSTPPNPLVEFAPRIFIYGGNSSENTINGNAPRWRWKTSGNVLTSYPKAFAVNYDNTTDETLSFTTEGVRPGLFVRYWKNYFNIIKDGVFATYYLKLNNNHIRKLDLQRMVYPDGLTYYIINKIADYKPLADESTKVELIKIG